MEETIPLTDGIHLLTGLAMSQLGRLREKQGGTVLRLDSFVFGFLFAFAMALVRFLYTT